MKQAHLFIHGFVQGVGFRQFVRKNANTLELTGWVRNTPNNSVEVVVQGLEKNIEQLIALCKKGPFLAEVEDIQVQYSEKTEDFTKFEVRHE